MKLYEIRDTLKAEVLSGEEQLDQTIVAAGSADRMDDILASVTGESVLLTGLATDEVVRTAKIAGVRAIVFVRGRKPGKTTIGLAHAYDLPVLLTRYSLFVASGRLYINGLRGLDGSW